MKNKLISDVIREEYVRVHGRPFPESRHTGDTIGAALKYIGKALQKPMVTIEIHTPNREYTLKVMERLIDYLGLKYLVLDGRKYTITYDLFE